MPCYEIDGVVPVIDPSAFVHPTAVLIGDVIVGPGCYVGPCASLRGDFGRIVLQAGSNVQDCCVLHSFPNHEMVIEENGHIGHAAVLHGCNVRRDALVGMNSVVMDEAEVGEKTIVAACAFVPAGRKLPPRTLCVGAPAKVLRELDDGEIARKREATAYYQELARRSLATMREVQPLHAVQADRKRLVLPPLQALTESSRQA
ncbi:MAG TPA: transferase hexapeptide repeat family protein [Rubrivivax sp.]|nr:transferase hexapeptide repeat family protein [Burkholderiales bacterium]HNU12367.1 transferase hexapeptide repeat family protein [Rubrivivax sp.]